MDKKVHIAKIFRREVDTDLYENLDLSKFEEYTLNSENGMRTVDFVCRCIPEHQKDNEFIMAIGLNIKTKKIMSIIYNPYNTYVIGFPAFYPKFSVYNVVYDAIETKEYDKKINDNVLQLALNSRLFGLYKVSCENVPKILDYVITVYNRRTLLCDNHTKDYVFKFDKGVENFKDKMNEINIRYIMDIYDKYEKV